MKAGGKNLTRFSNKEVLFLDTTDKVVLSVLPSFMSRSVMSHCLKWKMGNMYFFLVMVERNWILPEMHLRVTGRVKR